MKNAVRMQFLGAMALLGAGLFLGGCKSAPELTQANAQALIQASYDQAPAVGVNITVDDPGMVQGATAKYWTRTLVYPNRFWADFTISPEVKNVVELANGGDVIQWRPESPDDKKFSIVVSTVATNHLKARNIGDIQDEAGGKGADFSESVNLDGVPAPLQDIAHNPGNRLSTKRHANFVVDGTTWKLQSIQ